MQVSNLTHAMRFDTSDLVVITSFNLRQGQKYRIALHVSKLEPRSNVVHYELFTGALQLALKPAKALVNLMHQIEFEPFSEALLE